MATGDPRDWGDWSCSNCCESEKITVDISAMGNYSPASATDSYSPMAYDDVTNIPYDQCSTKELQEIMERCDDAIKTKCGSKEYNRLYSK
tara:strand:+ start:512 stop:781 length:270 start_codon:yes stop_codon:yes gene_type:complete